MTGAAKPLILGFMGLAGAGKTTAAHIISAEFFGCEITSFATPLKRACMDLFQFVPEQVYGHLKEATDPRWGFSPREAMRKLGTDCVRKMLLEDFWVRRMEETVKNSSSKIILLDDVRFPDEATMVLKSGSFLSKNILITRPGTEDCDHASENPPVEYADEIWANNGSVADFRRLIMASETVDMIGRYLCK